MLAADDIDFDKLSIMSRRGWSSTCGWVVERAKVEVPTGALAKAFAASRIARLSEHIITLRRDNKCPTTHNRPSACNRRQPRLVARPQAHRPSTSIANRCLWHANTMHCKCIVQREPCKVAKVAAAAAEPALIITSSASCYERARRQANATQLTAERISAVFSTEEGASSCRDTPTQRTYDATAAAHRAAWRVILQSNTSMAILEEDAEALVDAADMRAAIDRSLEEQCDLAYLGISGDFYGSFAYWATPRAAEYLLRVATKPRCNPHKPDYAMRFACLGPSLVHCLSRPASRGLCDVANLTRSGPPALRCLKPVRVLWRRELEGQGLFAMNHREYAAQTDKSMSNVTSRSEQVAEAREAQCKRMLAKNYHPPAIGQARKP